jgi:hypothetical protein
MYQKKACTEKLDVRPLSRPNRPESKKEVFAHQPFLHYHQKQSDLRQMQAVVQFRIHAQVFEVQLNLPLTLFFSLAAFVNLFIIVTLRT